MATVVILVIILAKHTWGPTWIHLSLVAMQDMFKKKEKKQTNKKQH